MELDLRLSALVNAAGAFLFLAEGIAILIMARGSKRGMLVGSLATTFGLTFVVENLLPYDTDPWAKIIVSVCAATALVALIATTTHFARSLTRRMKVVMLMAAGGAVLAGVVRAIGTADAAGAVSVDLGLSSVLANAAGALLQALQSGLGVLLITGASAMRSAPSRERRALALFTVAFGIFAVFINMQSAALSAVFVRGDSALAWTYYVVQLARAIPACIAILIVVAPPIADARAARIVYLALLASAAMAIGMLIAVGDDLGSFGIARTIGAGLLAVAILRHDLLGVSLPRIAADRGALATAALAALLIVAQIAQNYLSTEYGLLMGGVVAGALMFAAQPVQRAMERMTDRGHGRGQGQGQGQAQGHGADDAARREDLYLNAARLAMRDRRLTRAEEAHLHALADELGLGAKRAHDLLVQAEREAGVV